MQFSSVYFESFLVSFEREQVVLFCLLQRDDSMFDEVEQ